MCVHVMGLKRPAADTNIFSNLIFLLKPKYLHQHIRHKYNFQYFYILANTDITDIQVADTDTDTNMADNDIQFAFTHILLLVLAKYIG